MPAQNNGCFSCYSTKYFLSGSIFERYPCDEDGYAVAVDPANAEALRHAMDFYGVVVTHVLPAADCAAAADEIFTDCRVPRQGPPSAWENEHWPNPGLRC